MAQWAIKIINKVSVSKILLILIIKVKQWDLETILKIKGLVLGIITLKINNSALETITRTKV